MDTTDFLEAHPDPVVHYERSDGNLVVERINQAFEETFGADGGDIALQETLSSADDVATIGQAIEDGETLDRTVSCSTTDGTAAFRVRNVLAGSGGYLVYTDVDAENQDTDGEPRAGQDGDSEFQSERERKLEQRNKQLETFASVVSHDLRNPIDVAETYLAAAREDGDEEHFQRIADALTQMRSLIDDVLALAREGQVVDDAERTNLAEVAEDAWDGVETNDATLLVENEAATLQADPGRFRQLLTNLFRNAVEHGGDDVTVTIGTLDDGNGTGWFLEDDGPGIPQDEQTEVFEPGVTNSSDGTGLGLAITERIVDAHGWTIRASESENGGARFEVKSVDSLQPF